jgi:hypothetical protein
MQTRRTRLEEGSEIHDLSLVRVVDVKRFELLTEMAGVFPTFWKSSHMLIFQYIASLRKDLHTSGTASGFCSR